MAAEWRGRGPRSGHRDVRQQGVPPPYRARVHRPPRARHRGPAVGPAGRAAFGQPASTAQREALTGTTRLGALAHHLQHPPTRSTSPRSAPHSSPTRIRGYAPRARLGPGRQWFSSSAASPATCSSASVSSCRRIPGRGRAGREQAPGRCPAGRSGRPGVKLRGAARWASVARAIPGHRPASQLRRRAGRAGRQVLAHPPGVLQQAGHVAPGQNRERPRARAGAQSAGSARGPGASGQGAACGRRHRRPRRNPAPPHGPHGVLSCAPAAPPRRHRRRSPSIGSPGLNAAGGAIGLVRVGQPVAASSPNARSMVGAQSATRPTLSTGRRRGSASSPQRHRSRPSCASASRRRSWASATRAPDLDDTSWPRR